MPKIRLRSRRPTSGSCSSGQGGLPLGDPAAILALVRLLVLSGLGMLLIGSGHPGSMGEHGISHYLDMFLRPHTGSLHGSRSASRP
jgi:glycerol-1-phosphate dehydrogenase [NAD(P)+]